MDSLANANNGIAPVVDNHAPDDLNHTRSNLNHTHNNSNAGHIDSEHAAPVNHTPCPALSAAATAKYAVSPPNHTRSYPGRINVHRVYSSECQQDDHLKTGRTPSPDPDPNPVPNPAPNRTPYNNGNNTASLHREVVDNHSYFKEEGSFILLIYIVQL